MAIDVEEGRLIHKEELLRGTDPRAAFLAGDLPEIIVHFPLPHFSVLPC